MAVDSLAGCARERKKVSKTIKNNTIKICAQINENQYKSHDRKSDAKEIDNHQKRVRKENPKPLEIIKKQGSTND